VLLKNASTDDTPGAIASLQHELRRHGVTVTGDDLQAAAPVARGCLLKVEGTLCRDWTLGELASNRLVIKAFERALLLVNYSSLGVTPWASPFLDVKAMARIKWSELPSKATTHCVVLRMLGEMSSGKQTLDLMARYVGTLHLGGTFALAISRASGAHEIWCGFPKPHDAEALARAINAQSQLSDGWATKYVLTADDACFDQIESAAPPPGMKRAKQPHPERRASQITARQRRWNHEGLE
jgi:hypothetical protein